MRRTRVARVMSRRVRMRWKTFHTLHTLETLDIIDSHCLLERGTTSSPPSLLRHAHRPRSSRIDVDQVDQSDHG